MSASPGHSLQLSRNLRDSLGFVALSSQPSDDMNDTSTVVVLSPTVGRKRQRGGGGGARAR